MPAKNKSLVLAPSKRPAGAGRPPLAPMTLDNPLTSMPPPMSLIGGSFSPLMRRENPSTSLRIGFPSAVNVTSRSVTVPSKSFFSDEGMAAIPLKRRSILAGLNRSARGLLGSLNWNVAAETRTGSF